MSLDTLLTIALDIAYVIVLVFTLVDFLRNRDRVRLVVMLSFASLAAVLLAPLVQQVLPSLGPTSSYVLAPALLAQPVLVILLVHFVRGLRRVALAAVAVAFVGLNAAVFALVASNDTPSSAVVAALAVALIVYFVALEGGGAVGFAMAARERAGASRSRLLTASLATALLGLALVLLLGAGLTTTPGSEAMATANLVARVVALLSAIGYLIAFAPPRRLRRFNQQGILYDFIRDLNALPSGTAVDRIWELLERTARQSSGADGVEAIADPNAWAREPDAGKAPVARSAARSRRIVTMPFSSTRWPNGRLELDLYGRGLFRDDDLELIGLLLDRAIRAAEREAYVVERERLIGDLQAASAAKSDFLAAMSHELRTPLNAIIGFSELLAEGGEEAAEPATVSTYAEHIHGSGLHLLELVNDVLDLARVEAGRLDLKPSRFELDDLVRQTVASVRPLADQKHQALVLDLDPATIDADAGRIRQIVLNLLSNAVKFTGDGGEIRLSLASEGGHHVQLSVADTGRGIAKADLERVFEAFQQGSGGETASHHEGTGLGLALTRQLVEAHDGQVRVESELGVGSRFTVRLPVLRPAAGSATEFAPSLAGDRPRVLVIEDDLAAQQLLRVHLEGAGYAVAATASGRTGLAWVAELQPAAVVLDILLPDLDGWEVLQRLKSDPATRAVPVMVVSAIDDRKLGLALGAMDYMVKPVSRELLLESIGRLTFTTKVRTGTVTALVVDSDVGALDRYRDLLEPEGFQVIGAADGATARRRAIDDHPDLILLDVLLPDVHGLELAATLRHDPRTSAIPIWLSTPAGLAPEARARLNGNIQGVFERGDDALAALRRWLETGPPGRPMVVIGEARSPGQRQPARAAARVATPKARRGDGARTSTRGAGA